MGLDIQKLIEATEKLVYSKKAENGDIVQDSGRDDRKNKIDTMFELSVFKMLAKKEYEGKSLEEALKQAENMFNEEMGLDIQANKERAKVAKAPKKAPEGNESDNKGGGISVYVDNSINININLKIDQQIAVNINNIVEAGSKGDGFDIDALRELLEELIKEKGGNIQQFIANLFNAFLEKAGDKMGEFQNVLDEILKEIQLQNATLEDMHNSIKTLVEQELKFFENLGFDITTIKEAILHNGETEEAQLAMLGQIYDAIMDFQSDFGKYTKEQRAFLQEQFDSIMKMFVDGNVNMEEVKNILNLIKADTANGNENLEEIKELLALINDGVKENNEIGKQILEMLANGDANMEEVKELLALIKADTANGNKNLEEIKELLQLIKADTSEGNEISKQILEELKNGNKDLKEIIELITNIEIPEGNGNVTVNIDTSAIEALLATYAEKGLEGLEDIKELLQTINEGVKNNGEIAKLNGEVLKEILDAIKEFGPDVTASLTAILQGLDKNDENGEAIKKLLEQVLAQVKQNGDDNNENFQKVIDAIKGVGNIANAILDNTDELNDKADTMIDLLTKLVDKPETPVSVDINLDDLKDFLANLITTVNVNNNVNTDRILEAIAGIEGCNCDHSELIISIEKIITILKNDGQNTQGNEGIIEDELKNLFQVRRKNDEDTTGIHDVKNNATGNGKKAFIDGALRIKANDGHIYNIDGSLYK